MTVDLPPRRALPEDVRERMRPDFAEAPRRRHAPLAVAAGVALLVAGGVAVTRSLGHDVDPGRDRVVAPTIRDLDRCRAALGDQAWSSSGMVVFGPRKVLVGDDGRVCELTLTRAGFSSRVPQPVELEAGSITYRSANVIVGVPPEGTTAVQVRVANPAHGRGQSEAVVTRDFFVVHNPLTVTSDELVFDDRPVTVPRTMRWPAGGEVDSFESGDPDPWAPVNVLARCVDSAFMTENAKAEDLRYWEPLLESGLDRRDAVLVAHRGHGEWASCAVSERRVNALSTIRTAPADPNAAQVLGGRQAGSEFVMIARTTPAATTAEVSDSGGPPVAADVADGFFIARLPLTGGEMISPARLRLVARDAGNQVVYDGGIS
ncbi:hypothetical protein [Lentzea sp. NPDC060358]|uniref:hypothetical protein n=1 Tax=Lentzea sp. NPDC060358 TaxID=3347103 RepID=UPI0036676A1E